MRLIITALATVLVLLVGASAYLLLQSCAVRLPVIGTVLSVCETADQQKLEDDLIAIDRANRDLLLRIGGLEQQLAQLQCKAEPPPPPPPPPPKPKPKPKPKTPSGLAPDAFDNDDIAAMKGCWQLDSNMTTRDVRTGAISKVRSWRICLDANGRGTEDMRFTNGAVCKGSVTAKLPGNGTFSIHQTRDLRCSDGRTIFRIDAYCRLDSSGRASCPTRQQGRNTDTVTLRRARR